MPLSQFPNKKLPSPLPFFLRLGLDFSSWKLTFLTNYPGVQDIEGLRNLLMKLKLFVLILTRELCDFAYFQSTSVEFEKLFALLRISKDKQRMISDIFKEALKVSWSSLGPMSFRASVKRESYLRLVNSFTERFIFFSRSNCHSPLNFTETAIHSDSSLSRTSTFTYFLSSRQENKLTRTYLIRPSLLFNSIE